jgi:hypothetical protein
MDQKMEKLILNNHAIYLTNDFLNEIFKNYKYSKDKIKNLVKSNDLIKIVKGLYIPGEDYKKLYSKEVLAGIIYGPSAISLTYALSYYDLIPEKVETITSISFKKNKIFKTPIGFFSYKYIPQQKYPVGLRYEQTELGNFFIAGPEKAICDLAYFEKIISTEAALEYLIDDLRIYESSLLKLDIELLLEIKKIYRKESVTNIVNAILIYQSKNKVKYE